MLGTARSLIASRLSAVVVAFALSGGLPLVEGDGQDHAPHRCHCHHGPGEFCICSRCLRAPSAATDAELEKLPPCHRAAARAARDRTAQASRSGRPMLTGCCSTPGPQRATLAAADPFVLPPALRLPAAGGGEDLRRSGVEPRDARREPPTPPPRA